MSWQFSCFCWNELFSDYYYYATAGGARFWVCASRTCQMSLLRFSLVEKIFDDYANCSVCDWHLCRIFRKFVSSWSASIWTLTNLFAAYEHTVATYYSDLFPHFGNCAGSEFSAVFGCALLTTYLGLFINFYFQTYKAPAKSSSNGVVNGHANGKANGHGNGNGIMYVPFFHACENVFLLRYFVDTRRGELKLHSPGHQRRVGYIPWKFYVQTNSIENFVG